MTKYASLVKQKLDALSAWKLEHVPQDYNERADALASVAASLPITETVFLPIYYQTDSFILCAQVNQVEEVPPSWMDPIRLYIATGELPNDRDKAHKVLVQSARFSMIDGQLAVQTIPRRAVPDVSNPRTRPVCIS